MYAACLVHLFRRFHGSSTGNIRDANNHQPTVWHHLDTPVFAASVMAFIISSAMVGIHTYIDGHPDRVCHRDAGK
jgi:hypothetical protein